MRIETVDGSLALQVNPYRWRLSGSFLAHLYKATTQQHHRALAATIMRLVPPASVVFDIGAHAGQYTKLFANAAAEGRVYAVEPGSYARSILRSVVWLHGLPPMSRFCQWRSAPAPSSAH
jgi:hypothetical protein